MKKYCADTNFLLSFLTDRNIEQQAAAKKYFEKALKAEIEIIVIENVITELVYVLQSIYRVSRDNIHEILRSLSLTPGIKIDTYFSLNELIQLWPESVSDYGDALLIKYAKKNKTGILTFDKKMKGIMKKTGIKLT